MRVCRSFASRVAAVITGASLVIVVGCGDSSGLSRRYPVYGTVNYKGAPVPHGRITFTPTKAEERRIATGDIENGAYSLTTAIPDDGALPGSYKVSVEAVEVDTAPMKAITKGQFHHDATFGKAVKNAKQLVPAKYKLAETSGLTAEVKEQSNKYDFDLRD